ncbi:MAG TPA: hypothetical protein VGF92_15815 [Stellaceae bacterium]|jgi:hypothetical protein
MTDVNSPGASHSAPLFNREAKKRFDALNVGEPYLLRRFLPRCPQAALEPERHLEHLGKHPLAYSPPLDPSRCPECGASLPPAPDAVFQDAVITSRKPSMLLARALLAIGRFFHSIAKRIDR